MPAGDGQERHLVWRPPCSNPQLCRGQVPDPPHVSHLRPLPSCLRAQFVEDIAIMQQTDLFIAFHGAGMQNAVFLRNQSATLELRPHSLATKHAWAHL